MHVRHVRPQAPRVPAAGPGRARRVARTLARAGRVALTAISAAVLMGAGDQVLNYQRVLCEEADAHLAGCCGWHHGAGV
ncbi:MAG: hypothetical protein HY744_28025 [Deltaproteobacteria bacterium]|nr:hypothetical protein [Deltaproteobacteria bacterium]